MVCDLNRRGPYIIIIDSLMLKDRYLTPFVAEDLKGKMARKVVPFVRFMRFFSYIDVE
jgi:hypothetical protein